MGRYKKLTILHSNDLHGDFLSKDLDMHALGGVSMLSGYVNKTRGEEPNTLFCIAGDMLQGSVIDSEYKGISTIEIMNMLSPDVASIGNHEIDYGLAHLLFLERCARFPIVNANLFIKNPYTRLFSPYIILEIDGMKVMFIGIITNEIMQGVRKDLLGSFVDVEDAAQEVGHICNAYRNIDIDFTVLLTHIGFEEDKKLASLLDPEWGVDVIIGGHSHTVLEKPEEVAGILIAHAGVGTEQVGRFDIVVDTDLNSVHEYSWQLVPIDSSHCPRNLEMEKIIYRFKKEVDDKYKRIICQFIRPLTHPDRYQETELGNLFADILRDSLEVDIALLGSGSIRKTEMSSTLTFGELLEVFPYDDMMVRLKISGRQIKNVLRYVLRDEMLQGRHTEFFQYSQGLKVVYDTGKKEFLHFDYNGVPINEDRIYSVALQDFHYKNLEESLGLTRAEIQEHERPRVVTTSVMDILVERLSGNHFREKSVDGRLVIQ